MKPDTTDTLQATGRQLQAMEVSMGGCDVDTTYARALREGAMSESEPEGKPCGHRNAGVIDRNGVTWWIGAPVR
jgi:uncharacterized glyoxalase superfamily protein PhnB